VNWLIALVVLPLASYLLGSIPFGYLAGRLKGIDIRQHGSRNVGATNVGRVLGRRWGLAVFALDVLKGAVPVVGAGLWLHRAGEFAGPGLLALWMLDAFAAVAGHVWPVWLGFRGGKGVATYIGVLLGLYWPLGIVFCALWLAVALATRYSSLSALVASASIPCLLGVLGEWRLAALFVLLTSLLYWRHAANIGRLLRGEEARIGES
jgi:glycerol-3-phosphate acyltransferase PlsY